MRSYFEKWSSSKVADRVINESEKMRLSFFVNCWHASEYESAALWGQYAEHAGLAVRTTVGRLKSSIDSETPYFIGQIEYRDFSERAFPASMNSLLPAFLKRKSFEHEHEVRVLVFDFPRREFSVDCSQLQANETLSVDLSVLIDAIYLSPSVSKWLLPYLRKLLAQFGLPDTHIEASRLYDEHVY